MTYLRKLRNVLGRVLFLLFVIVVWTLALLLLAAGLAVGLIAAAVMWVGLLFREIHSLSQSRHFPNGFHECSASTYFKGYCRVCGTKMEDLS